MKFSEILKNIEITKTIGNLNIDITGITSDSRQVEKGNVFVAFKGFKKNGSEFIYEACKKGAAVIVAEVLPEFLAVPGIEVPEAREALALLSCAFWKHPSNELDICAVTGTNGKTSINFLLCHMMNISGKFSGLIGTLGYKIGENWGKLNLTTPEAVEIQCILRKMVNANVTWAFLEASSHALELHRLAGMRIKCGIFTNLTRDHLDFHKSMEAYKQAKFKLFKMLDKDSWVISNMDSEAGREIIITNSSKKIMSYGIEKKADIFPEKISQDISGSEITVCTPIGKIIYKINIPGITYVYNTLATIGFGILIGIDKEKITESLASFKVVPGRMEKIEWNGPFSIYVDYAHTPDAMELVLKNLKTISKGRVISVFGCGGDRDKGKRPQMGYIGALYSDISIITSDNPRSEEPEAIIKDILAGINAEQKSKIIINSDRYKAISLAINFASKDDIVIILGKGHEDYQILGDKRIHFDDREVIRDILDIDKGNLS